MTRVRIDLHVHSNASDGTDAPAEVIRRASAAALDILALTDHDTQAGIAQARDAVPGRPHIARAMAEAGVVATPADAFTAEWIADGGRAFVDRYAIPVDRAVALVRA